MNKEVAKHLLDIEAVFLSPSKPFTWASGIKSPIYCDNRLVLSHVEARNYIESALAEKIKEQYPECTCIVGTATAGIAHAAIVAHTLELPNAYVRSSNKEHGRQNQVEGRINKSDKVVVIEDLISTGGSVIKVVDVIHELGAEVLAVISIFSYDLQKGKDNFKNANCKYQSLTNISELVDVAVEHSYINNSEKQQVLKFIEAPNSEDWMNL